jgi:hypothetical protein
MPSEPSFTKQVSSVSVCTWFYILAVVVSIAAAFIVLVAFYTFSKNAKFIPVVSALAVGSVIFINAWALFLVCNRGIGKEGFLTKY